MLLGLDFPANGLNALPVAVRQREWQFAAVSSKAPWFEIADDLPQAEEYD
jgi:hypothetical protein